MNYGEKIEASNRYSFNIGYQGTEENSETHRRFLEISKKYDKVYIATLRVLLDCYEQCQQYNSILEKIDELELLTANLQASIDDLKKQPEKKPTLKTFGKEE